MSYRTGGGRPICKFFLEGRCKFGDGCKNEHPRNQQAQSQNFNRFGAFQNTGNGGSVAPRGNDRNRPGDNRNALPFGLNRDLIRADVTSGGEDGERPSWPMSCYAPGRDAPRQLIEGPDYEISPEEVRVLYYLAKASGDVAQMQRYQQNEQAAAAKSEQAAQEIRNDPDRFIRLVIDAENIHPNRNDQTIKPSVPWQRPFHTAPSGGFGAPSQASPFAQPAAQTNPVMHQSRFATQPAAQSGFGAPSALGNRPSPAFGAPSFPGSTASPFGGQQQSQQPQPPSSGFGAPSALGNKPSPFSQQPHPTPSGFGQPSSLGASTNRPSPFAQQGASPFAQNTPVSASPFSQTNPPNPAQAQNTFGSAFGQPSSIGSSFGNTNRASPFGQNPNPSGGANPFGQPSSARQPELKQDATKTPIAPTADSHSTRHPNGALATWKGQNVSWTRPRGDETGPPVPTVYNARYGKPERIWLPDGPPTAANADAEGVAEAYAGENGTTLQAMYEWVRDKGEFKDGLMPEIPPKREWIRWDV